MKEEQTCSTAASSDDESSQCSASGSDKHTQSQHEEEDCMLKAIAMHYEAQGLTVIMSPRATSSSATSSSAARTQESTTCASAQETSGKEALPCFGVPCATRTASTASSSPGAYSNAPGKKLKRKDSIEYGKVYGTTGHQHTKTTSNHSEDDQEQKKPAAPFPTILKKSPPAASSIHKSAQRTLSDSSGVSDVTMDRDLKKKKKSSAPPPSAQRFPAPRSKTSASKATTASAKLLPQQDDIECGNAPQQNQQQYAREFDAILEACGGGDGSSHSDSSCCSSCSSVSDVDDEDRHNDGYDDDYFPMLGNLSETCLGNMRGSNNSRLSDLDLELPIASEVVDTNDQAFEFTSMRLLDDETRERVMQELVDDCSVSVATTVSAGSEASNRRRGSDGGKLRPWRKQTSNKACCALVCIMVVSLLANLLFIIVLSSSSSKSASHTIILEEEPPYVWNSTRIRGSSASQPPQSPPLILPDDNTVVATVVETICYETAPLMGASTNPNCPPQPLGSAVTNLVAQSRLWSVPEADLAVLSAGQVRADILPGNLTVAMAKEILLPNAQNTTLVSLPLKGARILALLERSIGKVWQDQRIQQVFQQEGSNTTTGGSYPYAAGLRFDVDMAESFPYRVSNVQVQQKEGTRNGQKSLKSNGTWMPIDPQQTYTVVTDSYLLAHGGDAYQEMKSSFMRQHEDLNSLVQFVAYCKQEGVLESPTENEFSTQAYAIYSALLH